MNREIACSISPVHQNTEKNGSVSELKRLFDQFDVDGDGKISPAELQNCLRIVGKDLSSEDAEDVVHSMDADGDGLLCFDEFANLVKVEDEESEEERGKFLREAFRVYEVGGMHHPQEPEGSAATARAVEDGRRMHGDDPAIRCERRWCTLLR